MKKNILIQILIVCGMISFMYSCDDIVTWDKDIKEELKASGPPSISYVSPIDDQYKTITVGALNQVILIHGTNLSGVKSIYFNDLPADAWEIHATDSMVGVRIPRKLPGDVSNKLVYTTSLGTTELDFEVTLPQLIVDGLYNEFANPGDTTSIVGDNFDLFGLTQEDGLVTINGSIDMAIPILAASQNVLQIVLPLNIPEESRLVLTSDIIEEQLGESVSIPYKDRGFVLQDYKNLPSKAPSGDIKWLANGSEAGTPAPLIKGEYYYHIDEIVDPGNIYWGQFINGYQFAVTEADADLVNVEDYYFKFEILTMPGYALTQPEFTLSFFMSGVWNPQAWAPAAKGIPLDTNGKWKTITLDGAIFAGNSPTDGIQVGTNNSFLAITQQINMTTSNFAVTNFRFVKK